MFLLWKINKKGLIYNFVGGYKVVPLSSRKQSIAVQQTDVCDPAREMPFYIAFRFICTFVYMTQKSDPVTSCIFCFLFSLLRKKKWQQLLCWPLARNRRLVDKWTCNIKEAQTKYCLGRSEIGFCWEGWGGCTKNKPKSEFSFCLYDGNICSRAPKVQ